MRFPANNLRFRPGSRRGTSLVEVLVVLVILVVGIFSIARLFPGGFIALRSAENNTFADRLSQGQLESLKQNDAFLLDAVYMYNPDGSFSPNVAPTDLTGTTANPFVASGAQAGDVSYNDINKARFISGETFSVPSANVAPGTATTGVPVHTLNYGPIALPTFGSQPGSPQVISNSPTAPAAVRGLPPIHSAPWAAKVGNSQSPVPSDTTGTYQVPGGYDNTPDVISINQPNYAIDYTGQRIAVPPTPYPQSFTLVLKIRLAPVSAGSPPGTVTYYLPLLIPAGNDPSTPYTGTWFDPTTTYVDTTRLPNANTFVTDIPTPTQTPDTDTNYSAAWLSGTASLVRTLQMQKANGGGPSATITDLKANPDPYTYVLLSDNLNGPVTLNNVGLGVFAFSPRLTGQNVSVSYVAYDWHVIHEDEDAPEAASTPIRLTLNHLKKAGDIQSDESVYNGLFRPADTSDATGPNYDIVLLDTDTGVSQGLNATSAVVYDEDSTTAGNPATNQVQVSYLGGRITLPTDSTNPWYYQRHKHLRVYYRGDLDWAVAVQKAPSQYARNDAGLTLTGGSYPLQLGQYAVDVATQNVYFPRADAGKTVELDDVIYYDQSGKQYQVSNIVLALSTGDSSTYPDQKTGATVTSGIRQAGSDTQNLGSYLPVDSSSSPFDPTKGILIGAVRGVSATAVVIWKERTQWKTRNIDTILTRAQ